MSGFVKQIWIFLKDKMPFQGSIILDLCNGTREGTREGMWASKIFCILHIALFIASSVALLCDNIFLIA